MIRPLCSCEAPPAVPCVQLGPPAQEGQGAAGVSPQEGHEGNQRDRALPLWLRELPRSAQRREGSGEILEQPSST